MNPEEIGEKVENLADLVTPENIAMLSDEDMEKLDELLDRIEEMFEE